MQLRNELVDGLLVLLGVEVNDERVDHIDGTALIQELLVRLGDQSVAKN